jgi:LmbE family N-acetylglucosaminyl deacetylase
MSNRAFAIAAHPDDIEFMMAGTLALLGQAGYELHYMTIANGCLGSMEHDAATTAHMRRNEARAAATLIGALFHESLVDDMGVYYDDNLLRRLSAIVREVAPEIILTHSTSEYMEDHTNTTRLVLSAAFVRGMPNYATAPPRPAIQQPVTVYHALPYGLLDPLRSPVTPGLYVDIGDTIDMKKAMLAAHRSQKQWLDKTQGIGAYIEAMEDMARRVGRMSGQFSVAEGWTRHLHLGYCAEDADPLAQTLGCRVVTAGGARWGQPRVA